MTYVYINGIQLGLAWIFPFIYYTVNLATLACTRLTKIKNVTRILPCPLQHLHNFQPLGGKAATNSHVCSYPVVLWDRLPAMESLGQRIYAFSVLIHIPTEFQKGIAFVIFTSNALHTPMLPI